MYTFPKGGRRAVVTIALAILLLCVPFSQAEAPANFGPDGMSEAEYGALRDELTLDINQSLSERVESDQQVYSDSMETAGLGFVNGVPDAGAIAWYDALDIAVNAITAKYGLTDEDLNNFTALFSYNIADPDAPLWQVDLTPTDASRQLELGMYGANIFAKTGELRNVHSHEDSVG